MKPFLLGPEFSPERSFLCLSRSDAGRWRRRRRRDWSWKKGQRWREGKGAGPGVSADLGADFLASCAGSTCGLPQRGSEGEVGNNLQDPLTGFCSGKTASLPGEGCAEPGGGAGQESGGQQGAGFFRGTSQGVPLKSCPPGGQ